MTRRSKLASPGSGAIGLGSIGAAGLDIRHVTREPGPGGADCWIWAARQARIAFGPARYGGDRDGWHVWVFDLEAGEWAAGIPRWRPDAEACLAEVTAAIGAASTRLASIGELAHAAGLKKAATWHRMRSAGAPLPALVSNGTTRIWWFSDGVAYLRGEKDAYLAELGLADWRPAPEGLVALDDIAAAAGKLKSVAWVKLNRLGAPGYVQLRCGRIYRSLREPVEYVSVDLPPGRKPHDQAEPAAEAP